MADLNGKRIKVDGKKFEVREHFTNRDDNIETIILTRAIKSGKRTKSRIVSNLSDLGYKNEDEVVYTTTEMQNISKFLMDSSRVDVNITMILDGGILKDTELKIIGPTWESPDKINIIFKEQGDGKIVEIDRELLFKSCLLWRERNDGFKPEKANDLDDEIEETLGGLGSILEDILKIRTHSPKEPSSSEAHDVLERLLGLGREKDSKQVSYKLGELAGMVDTVIKDIEDTEERFKTDQQFGDVLKNLFDGVDPRPGRRNDDLPEDMPDILKDFLHGKSSNEDRRAEGISIKEIDMDDAPQGIRELINELKRGRR